MPQVNDTVVYYAPAHLQQLASWPYQAVDAEERVAPAWLGHSGAPAALECTVAHLHYRFPTVSPTRFILYSMGDFLSDEQGYPFYECHYLRTGP